MTAKPLIHSHTRIAEAAADRKLTPLRRVLLMGVSQASLSHGTQKSAAAAADRKLAVLRNILSRRASVKDDLS